MTIGGAPRIGGGSPAELPAAATMLKELRDSRLRNEMLQEELAIASAEASLAREALDCCASQAAAELAGAGEAPASPLSTNAGAAAAAARAREEARELAEALVAAELALESALAANEQRGFCAECQQRGFLVAPPTANGFRHEAASPAGRPLLLGDSSSRLQRAADSGKQAGLEDRIAQLEAVNDALYAEMVERDALWSARARASDMQAETLRQSLAEAWSTNAAQADEFVRSLTEVQAQLTQMEVQAPWVSEAVAAAASFRSDGITRATSRAYH